MFEAFIGSLPLVIAAVLPPFVAMVRSAVKDNIPTRFWPLILSVGGAGVAFVAQQFGIDTTDLQTTSNDPAVWEGIIKHVTDGALVGLGGVGAHQLYRKTRVSE